MSSEQDSATLFQTHLFGAQCAQTFLGHTTVACVLNFPTLLQRSSPTFPYFCNNLLQSSSTSRFPSTALQHFSININLHIKHFLDTTSKRSISCTCTSKEHVAEENQQPTRHWRPFSWRDPDDMIPHLCSRSSYIIMATSLVFQRYFNVFQGFLSNWVTWTATY